MKKSMMRLLAVMAVATAGAAQAGMVEYTGTTLGGPTWQRPVANGNAPPVPPASGVGTNVPYSVQPFFVTESASFDFRSFGVSPPSWDNYLFLYEISFDPTSPFTNVIIGNDDFGQIGISGFSSNLAAGTQYFLVTTGFANDDAGTFRNTIEGGQLMGNIILGVVPEPGAVALLGIGLALAGGATVRRRLRAA